MATSAGDLSAKVVIHTVGPIYRNDRESAPILASAYRKSLALAEAMGLKSISFPSISTGAYGYPLEKAAMVALQTVFDSVRAGVGLSRIQLVCYSEQAFSAYQEAIAPYTAAGG